MPASSAQGARLAAHWAAGLQRRRRKKRKKEGGGHGRKKKKKEKKDKSDNCSEIVFSFGSFFIVLLVWCVFLTLFFVLIFLAFAVLCFPQLSCSFFSFLLLLLVLLLLFISYFFFHAAWRVFTHM